MTSIRGMPRAVLIAEFGFALHATDAEQPGINRIDVLQHDLSYARREVIQVRVDFEPGTVSRRHSHPGEEIAYVLEGTLEYRVDGNPPITLKAGDALFIPSGATHAARNAGAGNASELVTYLVRAGRPLTLISK
jgi:quercetin dioxygenase-like cupin family protein